MSLLQTRAAVISEIIVPLVLLCCIGTFPFIVSALSMPPPFLESWGANSLFFYVLPYFLTELTLLNGAMYLRKGVEKMNENMCTDWLRFNKISSVFCFLGNAIALRIFYCKGFLLVSLNAIQLVRFIVRGWSLHIINIFIKKLRKRNYCTFACDILHV